MMIMIIMVMVMVVVEVYFLIPFNVTKKQFLIFFRLLCNSSSCDLRICVLIYAGKLLDVRETHELQFLAARQVVFCEILLLPLSQVVLIYLPSLMELNCGCIRLMTSVNCCGEMDGLMYHNWAFTSYK